jgi:NADPH:quinone reductase
MDHGIDASHQDFVEVIRAETGGKGVEVVIDLLGGSALPGNLAAIAHRGRLVVVGLLGGSQGPLDLNLVLFKRITIVGTMLRARPIEEKIAATRRFADQVVPWLERGVVRPVVDSVFPFEEVQAAQKRLESNQVFGKVILTV